MFIMLIGGAILLIIAFLGVCFPMGMCCSNVFGIFEEFGEIEKEV